MVELLDCALSAIIEQWLEAIYIMATISGFSNDLRKIYKYQVLDN